MNIQSGKEIVFQHYPSKPMWTGSGDREVRKTFKFRKRFKSDPTVVASIAGFDVDDKTNARVEVDVVHASEDHFDVRVKTWSNTKLARVSISWIAYGN